MTEQITGQATEPVKKEPPAPARQLIVFSDDWGRHPSSCQHLVHSMLPECEVYWINTIGTRSPRFDLATMRRGLEKLAHWRPRADELAERRSTAGELSTNIHSGANQAPTVLNPLMWPGFDSRLARRLNKSLLAGFLRRHVPHLERSVVMTTVPLLADLVGIVPARRWVYYCVDDFSAWPGLDSKTLGEMERLLVARVDRVVAAGDSLAEHLLRLGREAPVITHGVDLAHWAEYERTDAAIPQLSSLRRPIALFWGLVDRRLDIKFLDALSRRMGAGSIVLIGPEQGPDPRLRDIENLHLLGPLPYDDLPAAAAAAAVLIMPYADLPVTQAMQPLKLKEYLATGKPAVVRRLPAVGPWEDCLDAVDTAADFAEAVVGRFSAPIPHDQQLARIRLKAEDWSGKAAALKKVLFE